VATEVAGSEIYIRVNSAKKVMWDPATLFFGDLVRGDVEALVHLHFVGVHYLRWLEVFCHVYGQLRLAGTGGPHYHDHLVLTPMMKQRLHR